MDVGDAGPLYDDAHATSAAATASAIEDAAADHPVENGAVNVHGIALGIEDAEELLRRHALEAVKPADDASDADADADADSAAPTHAAVPVLTGAHPTGSASAVYRFYEIEATLSLKRREESSIARCRLCRQEGRVERKSCVRFSKSVTSNLWRHLKENHPAVYEKHVGEKKTVQMHKLVNAKKRGRKRKPTQSNNAVGTPTNELEESERFLDDVEGDDETSATPEETPRKATKRTKRQPPGDHFFSDYALAMGASLPGGPTTEDKRVVINAERIREAAAFMCVHEMVPFDLCTSVGFRNLLSECQVPPALVGDPGVLGAVFGKQVVEDQAKKLITDVVDRTATVLKGVEGAHVQLVEWVDESGEGAGRRSSFGAFAVGLDAEFQPVRRCLCVLPSAQAKSNSSDEGIASDEVSKTILKKALEMLTAPRHTPTLVVAESRSLAEVFAVANEMDIFESIPNLLHHVILSTITGSASTSAFVIGDAAAARSDSLSPFHHEFESLYTVEAKPSEDMGEEAPSAILTELPSVLTGHTIRDIILKVLHLMAHIKRSPATRLVMRTIFVEELGGSIEAFAESFELGLSTIRIGVQTIYEVLTFAIKMMPTLQRYFDIHKDGASDFSKLNQLASLSAYEWDRVGHLASLLKPFADAVANLLQEKFITSSLIIPTVYTLLEKLRSLPSASSTSESAATDLPEDMMVLKNLAHAQLSATFGYLYTQPADDWTPELRRSFNWLWSATLLDPRTRPFVIKGALNQSQFWDIVKQEAASIAGMHRPRAIDAVNRSTSDDHESSSTSNGNSASDDAGQRESSTRDLWDDLQANLAICAEEEMLLASSKSALELAKSTNLLEVEISFLQEESRILLMANPLEWWQGMRLKYPYVARLARFVLSIPGRPPVEENPAVTDSGLISRLHNQGAVEEACAYVAASINLRLERQHPTVELASRQSLSWSTV